MQIVPLCHSCKHYEGRMSCAAFDKIPDTIIITGEQDHTKPIDGDNGIQFEVVENANQD